MRGWMADSTNKETAGKSRPCDSQLLRKVHSDIFAFASRETHIKNANTIDALKPKGINF